MDAMGKDWWRWHHERLLYFKLIEREGMPTILLFWLGYRDPPERSRRLFHRHQSSARTRRHHHHRRPREIGLQPENGCSAGTTRAGTT